MSERKYTNDTGISVPMAKGWTKPQLTTKMYSHQRASCRTRKHPYPTYTGSELREWLFNQPKFHELYAAWEASGFDKWLRPSLDRNDCTKTYSFDNMTLMTWRENNRKCFDGGEMRLKQGVAIDQLTLDGEYVKTFASFAEAAEAMNCHYASIHGAVTGKQKTSRGFKWRYSNV